MENNTQPPVSTPTPPQMPVEPAVLPSKPNLLVISLVIIEVITLLIAVYFAYQFGQLKKQVATPQPAPSPVSNLTFPTPTPNETANLKTYTNKELGIEFKYPQNWKEVSNCKLGTICFSSEDFEQTVNEVGDGGGFYVASRGGLFSISSSPRTASMKLDDFCHPGGPLNIPSCTDTKLGGINAKTRTEVWQSNVEYATVVGTLTDKLLIMVGLNYGSQGDKELLNQILSTFKFAQ